MEQTVERDGEMRQDRSAESLRRCQIPYQLQGPGPLLRTSQAPATAIFQMIVPVIH
jgi:hypothetical protein